MEKSQTIGGSTFTHIFPRFKDEIHIDEMQ